MRILRVAQKLYPDTKGGGQYHVHAMSRDQAAMGHDVTVLTTRDDQDLPEIENTHGYTVVRVSPGVTIGGNDVSPAVGRYLWDADSDDFDVIHAHSHLYFATNLAALKRMLGDIPLAITNHGLYSQSAPEWVFNAYLKTIGRWTFNQSDIVFCYTDTDKRRVRDLGVHSRVEVVSNGIDTERFKPDGPTSDLIDTGGPVALFVGRLVDGKQPHIAVDAIASVLDEHPEAEFYLCGDGPLRDELKIRTVERGVEDSVSFLGHVPYEEMPKVYRSSDVLVLPSRTEGVPRTVLEAIASGIPVVCSNLDQLQDLVDGRGKLVETTDSINVSQALTRFLSKRPTVDLLAPEYMWQQTVEQTMTHLHSIAE